MNAASRPHLSAAEPGPGPDADQHLSSLVDGECPQAVADGLCDRWRTDDLACHKPKGVTSAKPHRLTRALMRRADTLPVSCLPITT